MVEQKVGPRPAYSLKRNKQPSHLSWLPKFIFLQIPKLYFEQESGSLNYQLLYFRDYF